MSDPLFGEALTAAVKAGDVEAAAVLLWAICTYGAPAPKETDR